MSPARRPSTARRISSTILAAVLLVGVGALAAYTLAQLELAPPLGGRVPRVAHDAYRSASGAAPGVIGSCEVDWPVVAGIAQVAHLCLREPGDYRDRGELRRALIAYNSSGDYADEVLRWIDRYQAEPIDEILEANDEEA
ncbi:MAG: hypothetical protein LC798_02455 [Chloroflexi bacterium]|nr:hypothetical protein [Chloroflexota bacterium]